MLLVEKPLAHRVTQLKSWKRVAELRNLIVAEPESEIEATLELLEVFVRQALRPPHNGRAIIGRPGFTALYICL